MNIDKEREAFENLWLAGGGNFDNFIFSEDQGKYAAIENSDLTDKQKEMALYVVNNAYLFFVGGFKQAAKAQAAQEIQQALNDRLLVKLIREHVESHISEVSVNDLFDKGWFAAMQCVRHKIAMIEAQEQDQ